MISIAIIGILVAIAIPSFNQYKMRASNSAAESYIHFVAVSEEVYHTDHHLFVRGGIASGPAPTGILPNSSIPTGIGAAVGVFPVSGVDAVTGSPTGINYIAYVGHKNGNKVYAIDNVHSIQSRTSVPPDPATDAKSQNITQLIPNGWGSPL